MSNQQLFCSYGVRHNDFNLKFSLTQKKLYDLGRMLHIIKWLRMANFVRFNAKKVEEGNEIEMHSDKKYCRKFEIYHILFSLLKFFV